MASESFDGVTPVGIAPVGIALGANLGDRGRTLTAALRRLRAEPGLRVREVSRFYETSPVGGPAGQPAYWNAAVLADSQLEPAELLQRLHTIETEFGRVRTVVDGPRTLDLDLLWWGDRIQHDPACWLPHPRLSERAFVLVPLAELPGAQNWRHPEQGLTVAQMLCQLPAAEQADPRPVELPGANLPLTFAGQTVFITGSTTGLGAAMAAAFEARGARVLRHGRHPRPEQPDYLPAHLAEPGAAERLADAAWELAQGRLDVFIANAGADTLTGPAAHWSFERKLQELIQVDLLGTMLMARRLGERMRAQGHGVILTVGWDQAETGLEGDSGQLFAAIKGGIMNFTRSLALSLAPTVRVHNLAPGWMRTAWGETASRTWQDRVRQETPLRIWGLPEDLAEVACFAADPATRYLTGQTFRVNGGAVRA